ncbi:hypothetical protein [Thermomonas paludicola]|uniref:hypothetical protein n=1 Tax=Thermomonas paludicola TaxID=2884874 RepID=UPI0021142D93|nr:hypothetical protein [Thermomonas paludicola]
MKLINDSRLILGGIFLLVLLAIGGARWIAKSDVPNSTHDGRFDTRCNPWGDDASREFCEISFYSLIARPEQYHGRMIGVTGFLVKDFGKFVLFPSREHYEAGINVEGIEVIGAVRRDKGGEVTTQPPVIPQEISSLAQSGGVFPVYIVGLFDAKYLGTGSARLGAVHFHHMLLMQNIPKGESQ